MYMAHYVKKDKIFQPPRLVAFEILKAAAVTIVFFQKILGGFPQERHFESKHLFKIDTIGKCRQFFETVFADPAPLSQALKADQQGISGESGNGGIRRIAHSRR
jgi:hypothetical protein